MKLIRNFEATSVDCGVVGGLAVLTFLTLNSENVAVALRRDQLEALHSRIKRELEREPSPFHPELKAQEPSDPQT
jgi:hypothetical protein